MKNEYLIEQRFGHIKVNETLKKVFNLCMAKESLRYAIDRLCIHKDHFVTTDGRKLFALKFEHDFETGLYFLTSEGFCLLDSESRKFPDWQKILPNKEQQKTAVEIVYIDNENSISIATYRLNKAEVCFRVDWLINLFELLKDLDVRNLVVFSTNDNPEEDSMFMVTGYIRGTVQNKKETKQQKIEFTYLQMPISKGGLKE